MKLIRLIVVIAIAIFSVSALAVGAGLVSISTLVERIHKSATASDAIAAYADGVANAGGDLSIRQAFVHRMIELNHPELAEAQARELVDRVESGMSWAVLAFNAARGGEIETALTLIDTASRKSPSNEFVMRTAGDLLAWYDTAMDQSRVSAETKRAAEATRKRLGARAPYVEAYDDAHTVLLAANIAVDPEAVDPAVFEAVLSARQSAYVITGTTPRPFDSPMASFYAAPYALFPGYGYGYQTWAPQLYYGVDLYRSRLGQRTPFPFPAVGADTRYMRLPGLSSSGFALLNDEGSLIYQPNVIPFYAYGPQPIFYNSFYPAYGGSFIVNNFPQRGNGRWQGRGGGGGWQGGRGGGGAIGGGPMGGGPVMTPRSRISSSNGTMYPFFNTLPFSVPPGQPAQGMPPGGRRMR